MLEIFVGPHRLAAWNYSPPTRGRNIEETQQAHIFKEINLLALGSTDLKVERMKIFNIFMLDRRSKWLISFKILIFSNIPPMDL